ncbi:uncharacterized protein LACBIDRAFT_315042 [Laccaria bicolor S238N-H82]|uniref:Predicted protein n=1 Tax=Laccaria bicolor (strain S238N-H82 / ATCC MYA-4686) TaxID=486041 RepID=B0E549_LACBS|nr:uncharacterized protein LACBIDRAFT_315042 [Laccaria bicolor S238N-H82]EDQ98030.1 predicted protein [Laccaria bicolor S238N-H82]|eukprot:XP_001891317.1 predicted protein [Laccaria bicolor S238N-H82]
MRIRGRMACMHVRKPRKRAPARTRSCGMRDRMIIHAVEMIAWWYSCRVENITVVGEKVLELSPFHQFLSCRMQGRSQINVG